MHRQANDTITPRSGAFQLARSTREVPGKHVLARVRAPARCVKGLRQGVGLGSPNPHTTTSGFNRGSKKILQQHVSVCVRVLPFLCLCSLPHLMGIPCCWFVADELQVCSPLLTSVHC